MERSSAASGRRLLPTSDAINRVLGVLVIGLGLVFMGLIPGMQREWRIHVMPRVGGGWCADHRASHSAWAGLRASVRPWPPSQGLAFTRGQRGPRGAMLSLAYCLGLGLPFVLLALAFTRTARAVSFLRAHSEAILRIGGALLIVIGVMLVTGAWTAFTLWLRVTLPGFEDSALRVLG
jgi:cytochrome c-type biogenesis protein